jgi:predicted PurR-regulated permease PerM
MSLPDDAHGSSPNSDQRRLIWTAATALALAVLLALAGCAFWVFLQLLSWSYPIILPVGLAVLIALVCKPLVDFLEARGLPRTPGTLGVCVFLVAGFAIFWAFILPGVYNSTVGFVHDLPGNFSNFTKQVGDDTQSMPQVHDWIDSNLPVIQKKIPEYLAAGASKLLAPVGSAFGFIFGFGFVPIYVFYFIADQDHLAKQWQVFVPFRPGRVRDEVIAVLEEFSKELVGYLRGQVIVASVNGLLTFIGLTAIGVPQSLVLGIIAGALSIVPFLGIICSILPALLLAFSSANGDPTWEILKPALVLGVFALVQLTESMFVSPRVQSHSTGLHPLVIILGILIWSALLPGLLGPIVAVPLTCAVIVLLRRYVWRDVPRRKRGRAKVES